METQAKYEVATPDYDLADVKKYIAQGASDKELFMFMNIAKSYGLNPFRREVHFVKYGSNPASIVVGYETYLKRAERTGTLDGWSVTIQEQGTPRERAQITIYRKDRGKPFVWEVSRKEFDKGQSTWKLMPEFMLKKVAIAQGFRLCFPEQLAGMPYIPEEINGKGSEELPQHTVEQNEPITAQQQAPPVKEKTLFNQLMTARSNFCSLVMNNKEKMLDFLPDDLAAVKARWEKASSQGLGGVTKGAVWPLEPEKLEIPTVVDFGQSDDTPVDDTKQKTEFLEEIEKYADVLNDENWKLITRLFGCLNKTPQEIADTLPEVANEKFLDQCRKALAKQI